jgi:putative resolvase
MIEASVSIGRAATLLGVSVPTIRRWEKLGKIVVRFRTISDHRRFSMSEIKRIIGVTDKRKVIGYARVSSHDQNWIWRRRLND